MATRGFTGRTRSAETMQRLPPGQSLTHDFPVLSAGPTPIVRPEAWSFTLRHGVRPVQRWSWHEFNSLPQSRFTHDIHCVTKWSKFDTEWRGVLVEDILAAAGIEPPTGFVLAHSVDGYSTNLPIGDLLDGKAMVALRFGGEALAADHGGPARLVVPQLYFWKSAKWLSGLQFTERNEAGFWELRGYHMRGDPWQEQRYLGDE